VLCLDLRSQDAANVANLLRLHLRQLANIPCNEFGALLFEFADILYRNHLIYLFFAAFDNLRVIIGVDDGTFKMGQRRRKVCISR
jgi:hypothetical protein